MKNLVRRYQVPVSGWDYWYFDQELVAIRDEEGYEELKYCYNRYIDNPINFLTQRESMNFDEWDNHYKRYCRRDEHIVRAEAVAGHLDGLYMSEAYAKVKEALKYTRAYRGREFKFMMGLLDSYEIDDGKRYFKNRYGGYNSTRGWYNRSTSFLFENEEGYIERYIIGKIKGAPKNWRAYYERRRQRRKTDKEYKRDQTRMGIFYLKVINHPILMVHFERIKKEYETLNEIEKNSHRDRPDKKDFRKGWHSWEIYKWKQAKKAFTLEKRRRRDKIRQDLDSMVEGNFSSYYKTRQYLYSLYKECHHF